MTLSDGTLGYYMRRPDDCLAAAIATVLQVPLTDVPDPRLDEQVRAGRDPDEISRTTAEKLERWLHARGLRLVVHHRVPVNRARWIGVVVIDEMPPFCDHCLVMARGRLLHDPTVWRREEIDLARSVHGEQAAKIAMLMFGPSSIRYGLSFTKKE